MANLMEKVATDIDLDEAALPVLVEKFKAINAEDADIKDWATKFGYYVGEGQTPKKRKVTKGKGKGT